MRINNIIYFSPDLKLAALDLNNKTQILKHFPERIAGYYLEPIDELVQRKMAFAAGAIEFLLIDAFSRYASPENRVGIRIKDWCTNNLQINTKNASGFYKFFMCGILHEGHIKQFGQFSFDPEFNKPVQELQGYIVVNPANLLTSLQKHLADFVKKLESDATLYNVFLGRLKADLEDEIKLAQ